MRKSIIPALLGLMALAGCARDSGQSQRQAVRVRIQEVCPGKSPAVLPYVGQVEAFSSTMASFTGVGTLKSVLKSEGQRVVKGEVLAMMDPTQAVSALAAARAALSQAEDAWNRLKQLHDQGSLPDMSWVEINSKLQQAQSAYDICQKNLEDCTLRAPVSGVVGGEVMSAGETVLPSVAVMDILDIHQVKVTVSVPEQEIAAIHQGIASLITVDALGGATFQGGRIEKGVSADVMTHSYKVRILLDNPEGQLLPGMVCKVHFQEPSGDEDRILLPVRSVHRSPSKGLFVWVVRSGRAIRQEVTTGRLMGNDVVITSGLRSHDLVIVDGYQKVSQDTPVEF